MSNFMVHGFFPSLVLVPVSIGGTRSHRGARHLQGTRHRGQGVKRATHDALRQVGDSTWLRAT